MDTEIMLALLSSTLHPQEFEQSVLLDALANSNGDIEAAAQSLRSQPPRKRRKLDNTNLERWLIGSKPHTHSAPSMALEREYHSISSGPSRAASQTRSELRPAAVERSGLPSAPVSKVEIEPKDVSYSSLSVSVPRMRPLTLSTPELVAKHTPCTIHYSVLPPELACRLYHTLLCSNPDWQRASGHASSFYRRASTSGEQLHQETEYWYQGRLRELPPTFPAPVEEACQIIERIVNAEMCKRPRFPLEWGGFPSKGSKVVPAWHANVAASNCYAGAKENICFHSDQLTHLGPYPTIASLSLGVSRTFRLREVVPSDEKDKRTARTFDIPLRHNSLVIMHASTQEMFKHAVPPQSSIDMFHPPFPPSPSLTDDKERLARLQGASNARINVTFRFFRPDFLSRTIPRCKCSIPCILRPDMKNRYENASLAHPSGEDSNASNGIGITGRASTMAAGKKMIVARYWWACAVGGRNNGKGCKYWKEMDVESEGRGPFVKDVQ
ncbi:hypothetical protein C2E23DRAFT_806344 [Lenzites betulinus]|nr:hypothetical protein C2E23DRAFT_806344 [Lenzites betulinus]